jgi:hypothetical protein
MNLQSCKIHNLTKSRIFKKLLRFFFPHFDATIIANHRVPYKKGGGGSSPSLNYGVFCEFGSPMAHLCLILTPTYIKQPFFLFV